MMKSIEERLVGIAEGQCRLDVDKLLSPVNDFLTKHGMGPVAMGETPPVPYQQAKGALETLHTVLYDLAVADYRERQVETAVRKLESLRAPPPPPPQGYGEEETPQPPRKRAP
jgi:hypothetical protein